MDIYKKVISYAKEKGNVSVPLIQKESGLSYRTVRDAVRQLVESNLLIPDGELNFKPARSTAESIVTSRKHISQAEQYAINIDCGDEKYAQFIEKSKRDDTKKIKLICRKKEIAYAKAIEDFNNLPASSQIKLIDAMVHSGKIARYELYQLLRDEGDSRTKYSDTYISYSIAMSYLLQISDSAFEVLKKRLKLK